MKTKLVHVICSSEGEKKRGEWGRERRAGSREEEEMEETMVTRQGWREDDAQQGPQRGQDWKSEQQDDG